MGEEWVGLAPGVERGLREGAQHGAICQLSGYVDLDVMRMVDCGGVVAERGCGDGALKPSGESVP